MGTLKTFGTKVAVKLLAGTHFVGYTMAELALEAEVNLVKPSTTCSAEDRIAYAQSREDRSYARAQRLGLFKEPSPAIADMTQSEQ